MNRNLLIASTSTIHGSGYLEYLKDKVEEHFADANQIVFVPFARPGGASHEEYFQFAKKFFDNIGKELVGIHNLSDMVNGLRSAEGIFTGGGNTFVLLKALYDNKLIKPLRDVIARGIPYMGTSAGSNILGATVQTTNDMPIVYPPSFEALGAVPFNINPHYQDPDPASQHMGETRETRIKEFLHFNSQVVTGLREGSFFKVADDVIALQGPFSVRIFEPGKEPYEVSSEEDLSFLLG